MFLGKCIGLDTEEQARKIVCSLYDFGMIKTWYRDKPEGWTLVSGLWSPFYIQLRNLCSYPTLLKEIGEAMSQLLSSKIPKVSRIVGIAMAGIPIAVATSLVSGIPSAFTRKYDQGGTMTSDRTYGEHAFIEGEICNNDFLVIIDDVVTKMDSKFHAISQIQQEIKKHKIKGINCSTIAVVLDREQGASEIASNKNISLHSLIRFKSQALPFLAEKMADKELQVINDYLQNPRKYQDLLLQKTLINEAISRK